MPLDPATIDTDHPRTTDGREYPEYLRPFESFDEELLGLLAEREGETLDEFAVSIEDLRLRSAASRWLSSAEWRGLVARKAGGNGHPAWVLTARGRGRLTEPG